MIYENRKTILCYFWMKGICRNMDDNTSCMYAHGINDLKPNKVKCRYGNRCNRVDCRFNHDHIFNNDIIYFPIIRKKSKKNYNNIFNITELDTGVKNKCNNNTSISSVGVNVGIQTDNCTNLNKINKLERNYQKWINVYNIFEKYNYNYKLIKENINEIEKYVKDKNIYKVKERAIKIYNYYKKLKENNYIEYMSISNILKVKM